MIPATLRLAAPWSLALAGAVVVLLAPELAEACPVCNATKNEASRVAFLVTTGLLSLLPLMMLGGLLWWVRSVVRAAEQPEAP